MAVLPVYGAPALIVKTGKEKALVVSDLHIGIEGELTAKGISLPSQAPKIMERLVKLIDEKKPDRLIMLGDVKHGIPISSWQEWRELPKFFEDLLKLLPVEIVPGNHDGDIKGMVPRGVVVHEVGGMLLGKRKFVGLIHGHAWPAPELMKAELIVMGHNHPAVEFRDGLGGRTLEHVWLKAKLKRRKLPKTLQEAIREKPPEVLVMPAFGVLVGGAAVNRGVPRELIGPLFKSGAVKLDETEAYMLDGTFLGKISKLRK
jgi:hypothetical protein